MFGMSWTVIWKGIEGKARMSSKDTCPFPPPTSQRWIGPASFGRVSQGYAAHKAELCQKLREKGHDRIIDL